MAKTRKKSSRRAFVPRALLRTACVTTVVPLCAISACSTAGSGNPDGGASTGGFYGVAAAGYAGVAAAGYMGVAAGGYMGVGAGAFGGTAGMPSVAAAGYGGVGGVAAAGYGGVGGNGGYSGVAAGAFGGQMNDAAPDAPSDAGAEASDGSAMLETPPGDRDFGELGPSQANKPRPARSKRKRRG